MTARANILRTLRHIGLLPYVGGVLWEEVDRITVNCTSQLLTSTLIKQGWKEDRVDPKPWHPDALYSYREPGAKIPSLQICFLPGDRAEIDLDFFNPWGGDVVSFVGHGIEVFWHWLTRTKTNPVRMAKALDKRFGVEPV